MKLEPKRKPTGVSPGSPPTVEETTTTTGMEWWGRFRRFGWDILGIFLMAWAFMTFLGLAGWSRGVLLDAWVGSIRMAFGWLAWGMVAVFILLGLLCFRHYFQEFPHISLGRTLALEASAFFLLALLAVFGGMDLTRAESGKDGGVIGWGLASLLEVAFPYPWITIVLLFALLVLLSYGSGLLGWGFQALLKWLDAMSTSTATVAAQSPSSSTSTRPSEESEPDKPLSQAQRDSRLPPLDLLVEEQSAAPDEDTIIETGLRIEQVLAEFGLPVKVVGYRVGPTITQYAVEPGYVERMGADGEVTHMKVRVAQISALQRDLAMALSAERLRIEAPVPGRSYVGIEVPNPRNTVVRLRSLMQDEAFQRLNSPLALALGKDVSGQAVVADLARMPHLLIAGTTGSGKSVCVSAIVTCLVMNNTPERLRLVLLDPKMVELSRFNGLPHLLGKVETQMERMVAVLQWAVAEMENRYKVLEQARARDLETYNRRAEKRGQSPLPRIVVVVDELADLMMTAPEHTEPALVRLAQKARAIGIHLVVATQRPSTDVITGLIKANFPARIAFSVASSVDSRVILDVVGAETLLGKGDMLFLNPEVGTPQRAQGVMVADQEVERIIAYWQKQVPASEEPVPVPWEEFLVNAAEEEGDALLEEAIRIVRQARRASASLLQRRMRIGYPRAARLIDLMEEMEIVGPSQGGGKDREVLLPPLPEDGEENEQGS